MRLVIICKGANKLKRYETVKYEIRTDLKGKNSSPTDIKHRINFLEGHNSSKLFCLIEKNL